MSWADAGAGAPDAVLSLRADSVTLSLGRGSQARHHRVPISGAGAGGAASGSDRPLAGIAALRSALATLMVQALAPAHAGAPAGAGRRWRVLLAPPWLQLQALPWSAALLDAASARAYATAALAQQGVDGAAGDLLAIDPVPPLDAPRSLVRVSAEVLTALQDSARTAGARLHSVLALPLLAAAWCGRQAPARRGPDACVGQWLDGSLLLHVLPHGRPLPLHAARLAEGPAQAVVDDVAALLRRSALQVPLLAGAGAVPVLDLQQRPAPGRPAPASAAGADAPWPLLLPWPDPVDNPAALDLQLAAQAGHGFDLLPAAAGWLPEVPTPWRGGALAQRLHHPWAWAATVVAGLAAAWLGAQALAPVAPPRPTALATAPGSPGPAPVAPLPRADWAAAQQAAALIDLPLAPLLRALAPPASLPVRLVGLDLSRRETASTRTSTSPRASTSTSTDAGDALLRLTAEAPSVQDMAAYADLLAGRRGMQAVQLVRHQQAGPGGLMQRFVLELQWQP